MDADEDPGGAAHPTLFYGLWPRGDFQEEAAVHAEQEQRVSHRGTEATEERVPCCLCSSV